jgi:hypothetical protein
VERIVTREGLPRIGGFIEYGKILLRNRQAYLLRFAGLQRHSAPCHKSLRRFTGITGKRGVYFGNFHAFPVPSVFYIEI